MPGICDTLLIRLSVIPSLKYSALGSPPALTNGSTARESIVAAFGYGERTAARPIREATPAAHSSTRDRGPGTVGPSAHLGVGVETSESAAAVGPDASESANTTSLAVWNRLTRSFSRQCLTM